MCNRAPEAVPAVIPGLPEFSSIALVMSSLAPDGLVLISQRPFKCTPHLSRRVHMQPAFATAICQLSEASCPMLLDKIASATFGSRFCCFFKIVGQIGHNRSVMAVVPSSRRPKSCTEIVPKKLPKLYSMTLWLFEVGVRARPAWLPGPPYKYSPTDLQ